MLKLLEEFSEICMESIELGYIMKFVSIGTDSGEERQGEISQALSGISRYQLELGTRAWELHDKFKEYNKENSTDN